MAGLAHVPQRLALCVSGLCKWFGDVKAMVDLNLRLAHGQIRCLLGPSGCGKTTTLRLIADFDTPDTGSIHVGDRMVSGPGVNENPEQRRVGMVMLPHVVFFEPGSRVRVFMREGHSPLAFHDGRALGGAG